VALAHRQSGWLAAIGIKRCGYCGQPSPCMGELRQRVQPRDVEREKAVIEWQRRQLVQQDQLRQAGWPV
jgi:hypothetical protein